MSPAALPALALPPVDLDLQRADGRDHGFVDALVTHCLLAGLVLGDFGLRALLRVVARGSWPSEAPGVGGRLGQVLSATLSPHRERRPAAALRLRFRCIGISRSPQASARGTIEILRETTRTTSTAMRQP